MSPAPATSPGSPLTSLGLGPVIAGSLPRSLGTDEAPDRYTVSAPFSRRPERVEVEQISGERTRDALSRDGYSTIELVVSDRRLEISNTNLQELRDGLATWIADRLVAITAEMLQARADAAAVQLKSSRDQSERAAAVDVLAGTVAFTPTTASA